MSKATNFKLVILRPFNTETFYSVKVQIHFNIMFEINKYFYAENSAFLVV